jgi:SAM-dependent methyltransferase
MTDICDLCHASDLEFVYAPWGGMRGLSVHLCACCGLVQSLPRSDLATRRAPAISSGADWGNIRYGKGFRTEACLSLLRAQADLSKPLQVLDVGSGRGSFARAVLEAAGRVELTCVEPDERIAESCSGLARTRLLRSRIETAAFPDGQFDVIHSCHTIEHLASPAATLAAHRRSLRPDGLLILDAPNIALIGGDDIVEEWFIDKHLYHFSKPTLSRMLERSGFALVAGPDGKDRENLLIAARKQEDKAAQALRDPGEVHRARALIASYVRTRARNVSALTGVAAEITDLASQRVALWGAGRLFDALVLQGGLDPRCLSALVDTHLKAHMTARHGVDLAGPEALAELKPDYVVVMSRAFSTEIVASAARAAPGARIVLYADLLARAHARRAA